MDNDELDDNEELVKGKYVANIRITDDLTDIVLEEDMIDELWPEVVEDLYEIHSGHAYSAADNSNLSYTTGV